MSGSTSGEERIVTIENRLNFIGNLAILGISAAIGGGLGYATQSWIGAGDWSLPSVTVAALGTIIAARVLQKQFRAIR